MTEVEWGSEAKEAPKPKKSVPGWLWFCGGGCLLALIVGVVAVIFIGRAAKDAMDATKQWPSLNEVIAVDQPPPSDLTIVGMGMIPGVEDAWQLHAGDGQRQLLVMTFSGETGEQARSDFDDPENGELLPGMVGSLGGGKLEAAKITIQGREFPAARYTPEGANMINPPAVAIDATPEGGTTAVLLIFKHVGASTVHPTRTSRRS